MDPNSAAAPNFNMPTPGNTPGAGGVNPNDPVQQGINAGAPMTPPPLTPPPGAMQVSPQPQAPAPAVPAQPVVPAPVVLADPAAVAEDGDLIEKEWVLKAKAIVEQTRDDPYNQNKQMNKFKADYIKKRYNKDVKVNDE
jgi:hypothetical protein